MKSRSRRNQKSHDVGDVFVTTGSAARISRRALERVRAVERLFANVARRDDVDGDAMARLLDRQAARKRDQRALRRLIEREAAKRDASARSRASRRKRYGPNRASRIAGRRGPRRQHRAAQVAVQRRRGTLRASSLAKRLHKQWPDRVDERVERTVRRAPRSSASCSDRRSRPPRGNRFGSGAELSRGTCATRRIRTHERRIRRRGTVRERVD